MIKKKEQKVFVEELHCDKCGNKMYSNGLALLSNPMKYKYVCSNKDCQEVVELDESYPKTTYETVDIN